MFGIYTRSRAIDLSQPTKYAQSVEVESFWRSIRTAGAAEDAVILSSRTNRAHELPFSSFFDQKVFT